MASSTRANNAAAVIAVAAAAAVALAGAVALAPADSPIATPAAEARVVSGQGASAASDGAGGQGDSGSIVDAANNLKRVGLAVAGSVLALILAFVGIALLARRDYGEAVGVFVLGGVIGLFCWAPDAGKALIENTVLRITS